MAIGDSACACHLQYGYPMRVPLVYFSRQLIISTDRMPLPRIGRSHAYKSFGQLMPNTEDPKASNCACAGPLSRIGFLHTTQIPLSLAAMDLPTQYHKPHIPRLLLLPPHLAPPDSGPAVCANAAFNGPQDTTSLFFKFQTYMMLPSAMRICIPPALSRRGHIKTVRGNT